MQNKFLRNMRNANFYHPPNSTMIDVTPEPLRPWHKVALFVVGMCGTLIAALLVAVYAGVV